jgi:type IV secretion system protein VirB6
MNITNSLLEGLRGLSAQFDGVAQWAFFKLIFEHMDDEVETFRDNLLGETMAWVGSVALILLTIWILWQGYQIMSGRSRESLMTLVVSSLRSVLIVSAATAMAFGTSDLYKTFTDGMPREITHVVTGDDDEPADLIDESLDKMQWALIGIDALAAIDQQGLKEDKDRAMWMTGVGVAGPSVVGGALLLLYKLALALFVGFGPLFILSLLFEQTKSLFSRWLYYGIGTMFSLAVLSFVVAVAMKMVLAVAGTFALQYAIALGTGASTEGVNSMAMQQGGLGLILTVLLIMTPPMAAAFFGGTLGNFSGYSQFGSTGQPRDSTGRQMGQGGYVPQPVQTTQPVVPTQTGSFNNPALAGTPTSSYAGNHDVVRTSPGTPRGG